MSLLSVVIDEVKQRSVDETASNKNTTTIPLGIIYSCLCVFLIGLIVFSLYFSGIQSFFSATKIISVVDDGGLSDVTAAVHTADTIKNTKKNSTIIENALPINADINTYSDVALPFVDVNKSIKKNTLTVDFHDEKMASHSQVVIKQIELENKIHAAIKLNRITVPQGQSALDYYIKLNDYFPDNDHAIIFEKIKTAYVNHINTLIANKKVVNIRHVLSSMNRLEVSKEIIASIENKVLSYRKPISKKEKKEFEVSDGNINQSKKNTIVKVSPNLNDYTFFNSLMGSDKDVKQAELYVLNNKHAFYTYLGLGYYYFTNENTIKLTQLRTMFDANDADILYYLDALSYLVNDEASNALIQFEKINAKSPRWKKIEAHLLTLTSALYLKLNQYDKAYFQYKSLTDLDEKNPHYWLGLALSSEKLNYLSTSLIAYKKATRYARVNSPLFTYSSAQVNRMSQHKEIEVSQW